jgi:hypothetical protein
MADDSYFLPDDGFAAADDSKPALDSLANPEQWASMTFAPLPIDPEKFGPRWEQTRGAIARTAVALLRFDDQGLTRHFRAEADPLRRALETHAGLQQEIDYLKTHIDALEMASARVLCVASRCSEDPTTSRGRSE